MPAAKDMGPCPVIMHQGLHATPWAHEQQLHHGRILIVLKVSRIDPYLKGSLALVAARLIDEVPGHDDWVLTVPDARHKRY